MQNNTLKTGLFDSLRSLARTTPLREIKIFSEIVRLPAVARKDGTIWGNKNI